MQTKYFMTPFATFGRREALAEQADPLGKVSYTEGYTKRYAEKLTDNPLAQPIERKKFNQLLHDITSNLKQWQEYGFHQYSKKITYRKDFRCVYDDGTVGIGTRAFVCSTDNNHNAPSIDGKVQPGWRLANQPYVDLSDYANVVHQHTAAEIVSGTLPVTRGGTGSATFNANRLLLSGATATAPLRTAEPSSGAGLYLLSRGPGQDPAWNVSSRSTFLFQQPGVVGGSAEQPILNLNNHHTVFWLQTNRQISFKIDPAALSRPPSAWVTFEAGIKLTQTVNDAIKWLDRIWWQDGKRPVVSKPGVYYFGMRSVNNFDLWCGSLLGYWPS